MQTQIYTLLSQYKDQASASFNAEGVLSLAEMERYNKMKFSKRRSEWLHGRYAAKLLLKRSHPAIGGLRFDEITVANEDEGAPYYIICNEGKTITGLSISHCDKIAFCARTSDINIWLGVDVEMIEPRSKEFVEDFFTQDEMEKSYDCNPRLRDLYINLTWSAKESVLKSMHKGLRLDTRSIEIVSIEGLDNKDEDQMWERVVVRCYIGEEGRRSAWWISTQGYVFTLALWLKDGVDQDIQIVDVSENPYW